MAILVLAGCSCDAPAVESEPAPSAVAAPSPPSAMLVPQWLWTSIASSEQVTFVGHDAIAVVQGEATTLLDTASGRARAVVPTDPAWRGPVMPLRDGHAVWNAAGVWSLDDGSTQQLSGALLNDLGAQDALSHRAGAYVLPGAERLLVLGGARSVLADATGHVLAGNLTMGGFTSIPVDPTGRTFLLQDETRLLLHDARDGSIRASLDAGVTLAAYRPDGAEVVLVGDTGARVVDVATGAVRTTVSFDGYEAAGISVDGASILLVSPEHARLVDGHTLAVVADGPAPSTPRFPMMVSSGGAFVSPAIAGPTEIRDLRAGATHPLMDLVHVLAIDDDGSRVLVRGNDGLQLVDVASTTALWSVPDHMALSIRTLRVARDRIVVSGPLFTIVLDADGTIEQLECEEGYAREQPDGTVLVSCADGSVVDATTGVVSSPAGSPRDACVFDAEAAILHRATPPCDDAARVEQELTLANLRVDVGPVARVTRRTTHEVLSIGVHRGVAGLVVTIWDDRGRAADPTGELLIREPGPLLSATLHPAEASNPLRSFFERSR